MRVNETGSGRVAPRRSSDSWKRVNFGEPPSAWNTYTGRPVAHGSPVMLMLSAGETNRSAQARKLAQMFVENFKTFEQGVTAEVKAAGPRV